VFIRGEATIFDISASTTLIGRGSDCSVRLEAEGMSRRHARLSRTADKLTVEDLGSKNATYLNGHPLAPETPIPLADGDMLRIGEAVAIARCEKFELGQDHDLIPGISAAAAAIKSAIEAAAATDFPLLIVGPTGAGKEYVARAIHAASARAKGPFIAVNCGELDPQLGRAELFGAEKGSYSGSVQQRRGFAEVAEAGTLFLDELGELDATVQVILLRFVETGTFRSIGGEERKSNIRILAATNVDIERAILEQDFRRDLVARFRVTHPILNLLPLRKRREDLWPWLKLFLHEETLGASPIPSAGFLETLLLHEWPENLRELRQLARTLAPIVRDQQILAASHLPENIQATRTRARFEPHVPSESTEPDAESDDETPQSQPDTQKIRDALAATNGVMQNAAEMLKIGRRRLYRICAREGIDPNNFRRGSKK
jgi:DNA-binding NtrC family response regulator